MSRNRAETSSGDIDGELYAKRQKIYPREAHGIFALLRTSAVLLLLGVFVLVLLSLGVGGILLVRDLFKAPHSNIH